MSIIDQSIDVKLRIDEIHPKWVICHKTGLIKRIREGKILNLGCTVQSGSSRILKLMNRFNNVEEIKNTLLLLKQANPKLNLFGHIIIGFPTETEEDFNDTLNLVKDAQFNSIKIFIYTDREGTIASEMNNKINTETKKKRYMKALDFFRKEKIENIPEAIRDLSVLD